MAEILAGLGPGAICVVNAASYRDLEVFVVGLWQAVAAGKRFVYRTAASFVRVLAGIEPKPLLTKNELAAGSETWACSLSSAPMCPRARRSFGASGTAGDLPG